MKPIKYFIRVTILLLVQVLILWSCKEEKVAHPFPEFENEYEQPITKSFELSQSDTLVWTSKKFPAAASLPTKKFNWDKLPSKPFDIGNPHAFEESLPNQALNWDSLPRRDFNLDSLPNQEVKIKVTVLGTPKTVKAGFQENAVNASRGVMTFDADFGYPGTVSCHFLDTKGMLWFGGSTGIARYDGENLEMYDQEQGLSPRNIFAFYEDSKGRLWIAGDRGSISFIDFRAKLIYDLSISGFRGINDFIEAKDGKFWISNVGVGYDILDLKERISYRFNPEQGLLDNEAISPFQDSKGLIWLSTGKGVNIIDLKTKKNISFSTDQGLLGEFVISFHEDRSGNIWICGFPGISILNPLKNNISYMSGVLDLKKNDGVSDVFESRSGDFWIGTDKGKLYHYSVNSGLVEKIIIKESEEFVGIWNMSEDRQGQIWVPTIRDGIFLINEKGGRPGNFTKEDGVESMGVWSTLQAANGKIWIGGLGGIDIYDPKNNTISHIAKKDGLLTERSSRLMRDSKGRIWSYGIGVGVNIVDPNKATIQQFASQESMSGNWITSLFEDSKGNFWLGGNLGQLFFIDFKNEVFNEVIIDTIGDSNFIDNIVEDEDSRLWIAGRGLGIHILDPTHQYRSKLGEEEGLVSDDVYTLVKDDKNNLWTGTEKGVERINAVDKKVSTFTTEQGLASNDVYAIIQRQDKMLLGTSKGLSILKPQQSPTMEDPYWKINTLGKRQGLNFLDFNMNSFSIDKDGRFWAGVESQILTVIDEIPEDTISYAPFITGLNIFDKKQTFDDFELIAERLSKEDTIWSWESNDYVIKNKAEIISKGIDQKDVEWTGIKGSYHLPVNLNLPYDQNYLSFTFNAGQFKNPDKIVYRYILEGIDKNWSFITDKTVSENYRDLAPGDYTFKVASKGFNEIWSSPNKFSFTIVPPWWQTWWAYTIFVTLFLGLGLVILHYRSSWLKNENRILEERVTERTVELKKSINELESTQSQLIQSEKMASLGELTAGIAHEIQNPMNFINNFSEVTIELVDEMCEELDKGEVDEARGISKDIVQNLEKITHHGKRASSIVKGMLEHSRNSSGQKEFIDINVLADEYLRLAYHGLRAKDKSFNADFKTDFDETLPKVEIIPQDLGRVVLNIINNAFFAVTSIPEEERTGAYKPLVMVSTKNMGDQVLISIKDNGPGIPPELKDKIFQPFFTTKPTGKGTGLGLSLAYDIVTTGHGGAIELNTAPGEGTEFVIYIPIRK